MSKKATKYELLAPVGNFINLRAAINSGCDAIYFGIEGFNMRALAKNFKISDLNQIKKICDSESPLKKRIKMYLTLNIIIYDKELKKLKQQDGPDLQVHGSGHLIQTLLKHDLVDELWLKTFPITLGKGKRLFGDGTFPTAFRLLETNVSPSGVIFANYKRFGKVNTGSF